MRRRGIEREMERGRPREKEREGWRTWGKKDLRGRENLKNRKERERGGY